MSILKEKKKQMFGSKERQNRGLEKENKMRMKGGEEYQFLRVADETDKKSRSTVIRHLTGKLKTKQTNNKNKKEKKIK